MTNEPYTERMYCRRCKNASVQQGTALRIGHADSTNDGSKRGNRVKGV
nr:hypothetical protein [Ipomoea trifida]